MQSFQECTPGEGIERICSLLSRLAILGDVNKDEPLQQLFCVADAINHGDTLLAVRNYHKLCAALIAAPSRRVSGDLWVDYLLYLVLERENPFSKMGAASIIDEAVAMASRMDLAILGELATLGSSHIRRMVKDRHTELQLKPRHAKDTISLMSSAVWSGGTMRPLPGEDSSPPIAINSAPVLHAPPSEKEWLPWSYGEMELRGSFISDEALEEVYIRMLKSPDWRMLCEDIWNFFAAYGSGRFIKHRAFTLSDGELVPMEFDAAQLFPMSFYEPQRTLLIESAIRFMRGESARPLLLTGGSGTGKTTLALDMLYELPEVRLVRLAMEEIAHIPQLLLTLKDQPLRFVLLMDDLEFKSRQARAMLSLQTPPNVLLVATARTRGEDEARFDVLHMPYPSQGEFVEMVIELLAAEGIDADRQWVRNATVDYQVDAREKLSIPAAIAIARKYPL